MEAAMLLKKLWYKIFPIKHYVRDVHYKIFEGEESSVFTIKLLKGEYKDAVIGFEIVYTDEDSPRVTLRSRVVYSPDGKNFTDTMKWYNISVQIFDDEYKEMIEKYHRVKQEATRDEDDRTDYFEESFEERTLSPQGHSLSQRRVFSRQKRKTSVPRNERFHSKIQPPADHGSDSDIFGGKG
jgi:hypothetical protein